MKSCFVFLHMRKKFVRKYILPKKREVNSFLALSESNNSAIYLIQCMLYFWHKNINADN